MTPATRHDFLYGDPKRVRAARVQARARMDNRRLAQLLTFGGGMVWHYENAPLTRRTPLTKDELREIAILVLAEEIARQTRPESALAVAATPHEIARALYLLGWDPPAGYGLGSAA